MSGCGWRSGGWRFIGGTGFYTDHTVAQINLIAENYHIVITLKKNLLLSFLRIRIIVNGTDIYPIKSGEKIVIHFRENNPKIVVTDGFHFTKPLELVFHRVHTYYFNIVCAIDDVQLMFGAGLLTVLYLTGFATGIFILKLLSFFPLGYILFLYYINRKEFIHIKAV